MCISLHSQSCYGARVSRYAIVVMATNTILYDNTVCDFACFHGNDCVSLHGFALNITMSAYAAFSLYPKFACFMLHFCR